MPRFLSSRCRGRRLERVAESRLCRATEWRVATAGFVHTMDFRIMREIGLDDDYMEENNPSLFVEFRVRRNNRSTGQMRRHMSKPGEIAHKSSSRDTVVVPERENGLEWESAGGDCQCMVCGESVLVADYRAHLKAHGWLVS